MVINVGIGDELKGEFLKAIAMISVLVGFVVLFSLFSISIWLVVLVCLIGVGIYFFIQNIRRR